MHRISRFLFDSYYHLRINTLLLQAKEFLANPDAFVAAAPVEEAAPVAETKEEEKEEEKEESDDDMVRGLYSVHFKTNGYVTGLWSVRLGYSFAYST
jgi:60s Acidic ribosomal protein